MGDNPLPCRRSRASVVLGPTFIKPRHRVEGGTSTSLVQSLVPSNTGKGPGVTRVESLLLTRGVRLPTMLPTSYIRDDRVRDSDFKGGRKKRYEKDPVQVVGPGKSRGPPTSSILAPPPFLVAGPSFRPSGQVRVASHPSRPGPKTGHGDEEGYGEGLFRGPTVLSGPSQGGGGTTRVEPPPSAKEYI